MSQKVAWKQILNVPCNNNILHVNDMHVNCPLELIAYLMPYYSLTISTNGNENEP
jgi:hypothetical protein